MHRQAHNCVANLLAHRRWHRREVRISPLSRQWGWIVDRGRNPSVFEFRLELAAIWHLDGILCPRRRCAGNDFRNADAVRNTELLVITLRDHTALLDLLWEDAELLDEHGCLNRIQPRVHAN